MGLRMVSYMLHTSFSSVLPFAAGGNDQERHHPDRQRQEKPQMAEVVAVGPGGMVDGKEVEMTVKAGDR